MKMNAHNDLGGTEAQASLADDLRALVQVFTHRWRVIVLIMAAFFLLGIAYVWTSAPAFTSGTDIFIDPRERSLVDPGAVPTGMGSSSQGADISLLESQISILGSRTSLSRLIDQEGLLDDSEFTSEASGPMALVQGVLKAFMYGPNAGTYSGMAPIDRALARLKDAIKIGRVDQTYVLGISVTTGSPDKSARLANALAQIYLEQGQSAADDSARETAQSLEARLAELRKVSEASQRAVEDYRQANGLVNTEGVLIDERQLTDFSTQVVAASVATDSARVALENLRRDGAKAATSEVVKELQVQLEQARSEENALTASLGPRHPRLIQATQTRISLEASLQAELARVVERAQNDYDKAVQTEKSLKGMLAQSTDTLSKSNDASVRLRELEQVAEQDKALYDSFANKAKQMREQISLPTTTARVISIAEPASRPSEPKVPLVFAVALFLGGIAGFGTAWLLHIFSPRLPAPPRRFAVLKRQHPPVAAE